MTTDFPSTPPAVRIAAATVAFGVRNFEDLEKGLSEIYRVLKPGGILAVLETSVPERKPLRCGYHLYGKYLLPRIGKWFSSDGLAYTFPAGALAGAATGTAELRARLAFDPRLQKLQLQDLVFDYRAQDSTVATLVEAFHEPIRRALENVANEVLTEQLELLGERLGEEEWRLCV